MQQANLRLADDDALNAFLGQIVSDLGASLHVLKVVIGERSKSWYRPGRTHPVGEDHRRPHRRDASKRIRRQVSDLGGRSR